MTQMTIPATQIEARRAGWVCVGEWGLGRPGTGYIWCRPEDEVAVRAAYDAVPEYPGAGCDDMAPVGEAGGHWLPDAE